MKNESIHLLLILWTACFMWACDDHRTLHEINRPMIDVVVDWKGARIFPGEGLDDPGTQGASLLFYSLNSDSTLTNNIQLYEHNRADSTSHYRLNSEGIADLTQVADYMALSFNGITGAGIDYVRFSGHEKLSTFKAEATYNNLITVAGSRQNGYPFINNPDTLAVRSLQLEYKKNYLFIPVYINGVRQPDYNQQRTDTLYLAPRRLTYRVRIKVWVLEGMRYAIHEVTDDRYYYSLKSGKRYRIMANGYITGFVRGAYMHDRRPTNELVSQAFTLNGLNLQDGIAGTDSTTVAVFSSFGPPLNTSDSRFYVNLYFTLNVVNGGGKLKIEEFTDLDVTDQVNRKVEEILAARELERSQGKDVSIDLEIPIDLYIKIKGVGGSTGIVGLDEWDEVEVDLGRL